ncbi:MAG TPA: helix-turn-helix domain-containing protein [Candidatus Limnocylindrales bacterium]|nr:helix-turn-helix domain-containing protein [Candidatus Limnocylindrales bacterium]
MTTRDEARRATADSRADALRLDATRSGDARVDRNEARDPDRALGRQAPLPERLYAARERKGVDLYRAERDTKIRARYLAALERGEYRELPGDVYTKGFLRNYALYLGLDAEEVVSQWRRERGDAPVQKTVLTVPRPIAQPRKGLQFSPGIVVAALLTILIAGVGVWLGVQVMRFAKPPTLVMTSPREATLQLDSSTTAFTFEGKSIPGATITIEMAGGSRQVSADSTGVWSATVDLRRGRNEFTIDATDPDTGKHAETPAQIVITVPVSQGQGPQGQGPTLSIDNPADGAVFENGAISVQGHATNATSVTVTASYDGPVTGGSSSPSPSAAPTPSGAPSGGGTGPSLTLPVASDGTWDSATTPLQLTTGRWTISVKAANSTSSTTLTRHVSVAYKGVNLVVRIKGSAAWIKVWVDGQLDPTVKSGKTFTDGKVLTFTGKTSIEVRTGSSGATSFTLNGQSLGALGKRGIPETWLFEPPAAPQKTQRN